MAKTTLTAFADTTSQEVYSAAAYVTGVYVTNHAATATDGWINLVDGAYTAGTTVIDISLYVPWALDINRRTYRFSLPRIKFATSIQAFYSDTSHVDASAWSSTGLTGYEVVVYFEPVA